MRKYTHEQIQAAGGYELIYADPAWSYDDKGSNGAADNHYQTTTLEGMAALKVDAIASPHAVLFMWVTNPFLEKCFPLARAWGFEYKTKAFEWCKGKDGKEFFGMGRWARGNTESCLLFVRAPGKGKSKRPISASVRQLIYGIDPFERLAAGEALNTLTAPVMRHSAKPPETRERIVQLMGDLPRCELFARERVPGWDAFGNEVESSFDL